MSISISQTDNVGLTVESDPNALKIANNLSDITNTATARTNLAIDTTFVSLSGTQTVSGQKTLTAASLALGNSINASTYELGAGATISGVTKTIRVGTNGLAGSTTNITVGSTTGTSTTTLQGITNGVTQTVADNSTKLATTGYVSNSISSTSFIRMSAISGSGASSGTGASASILVNGFNSRSPTTLVGYGIYSFALTWHSRGSGSNLSIPLNWNKRFVAQFRFHPRTLGTEANTINRVLFGKANGTTTGELTLRGVGVRQIANGALELVVHDGTTFTAVTSSYTPAVNSSTDIRIVSDGAGNVTLFNNDTQIATTSAGPSTAGSTNNGFLTIESENIGVITGTNNTLYVGEISFEFAI